MGLAGRCFLEAQKSCREGPWVRLEEPVRPPDPFLMLLQTPPNWRSSEDRSPHNLVFDLDRHLK